eukprot:jgi/Botrbrau1/6703/Bobra.0202s0040.1
MEGVQYLLAMRHGERIDGTVDDWEQSAAQVWNPPLTERGKAEVQRHAKDLAAFSLQHIFVSPFLRCIQTAALLQDGLQDCHLTITVDPALSEVFSEKLLFGKARPADISALDTWMKSPEDIQQAWLDAGGSGDVQWSDNPFPDYPETLEDAHRRYTTAYEDIERTADGANVLVVTHGEAVRRSVLRIQPMALVYEVNYAGWTSSWRVMGPPAAAADDEDEEVDEDTWGLWHLQSPDPARGVAWV